MGFIRKIVFLLYNICQLKKQFKSILSYLKWEGKQKKTEIGRK